MNRKEKFMRKLLLSGVCFLLIVSCKVGLGESVDTKAPDISISYPPANTYVKGMVVFSGTASDDEYLDSVYLSFKRTDVKEDFNPVFNASLDRSSKTWTCSIETGDGKKVEDGVYEVTVKAIDGAGRNTEMRRTITIDNKAPTVLVTSPSTYGGNDSSLQCQKIDIKGSAYDATEILEVFAYICDETGNVVFSKKADGTSDWAVTFSYEELQPKEGTKLAEGSYYFYVTAKDSADNVNDYFYHQSDIYALMSGEDTVSAVKKYEAGTASSDIDTENTDSEAPATGDATSSEEEVFVFPSTRILGLMDQGLQDSYSNFTAEALRKVSKTVNISAAKTEAEANGEEFTYPDFIYEKTARTSVTWSNIGGDNPSLPSNGSITGVISRPSDGSSVKLDSIKAFIMPVVIEVNGTVIEGTAIENQQLEKTRDGDTVSFSIAPRKADGSELKSGTYKARIEFQTNSSKAVKESEELFTLSTGIPIVTETALSGNNESAISVQGTTNSIDFKFLGTAFERNGQDPAKIRCKLDTQDDYQEIPVGDSEENNGVWELSLKDILGENPVDGVYTVEFEAYVLDMKSTLTRIITLDTEAPVPGDETEVSQNAAGTELSIAGTASDATSSVKSVEWDFAAAENEASSEDGWELLADDAEELTGREWKTADGKNNWKVQKYPVSEDYECGYYVLYVKTTDTAGNTAVRKQRKPFLLDKADPVFTKLEISGDGKEGYFKSNESDNPITFSGTVSDDMGIESVTVYIDDKEADIKPELKLNEAGTTDIKWVFGETKDGSYSVRFEVTDIAGKKISETRSVWIDTEAPKLSLVDFNGGWVNRGKDSENPLSINGSSPDNLSGIAEVAYTLDDGENWVKLDNISSSWTFNIFGLDESTENDAYQIRFRAADKAGNISYYPSENGTISFFTDYEKPVVELLVEGEERTETYHTKGNDAKEILFSGTARDDAATDGRKIKSLSLTCSKNGVEIKDAKTKGSYTFNEDTGEWTWKIPVSAAGFGDGMYTVSVTAEDEAGNKVTVTATVQADTTAPELSVPELSDGMGFNSPRSFAVNASDSGTGLKAVTYSIGSDGSDDWSEEISVEDSSAAPVFTPGTGIKIRFTAEDELGNKVEKLFSGITYDENLPEIADGAVNTSKNGGYLKAGDNYTLLAGSENVITDDVAIASVEVTAAKDNVAQGTGGIWYRKEISGTEISLTAADLAIPVVNGTEANNGTWKITLKVKDKAGNETSETVSFTVDAGKPEVGIALYPLKKDSQLEDSFKFMGSVTDRGDSGVDKVEYRLEGWENWKEADGKATWSCEENLEEGEGKLYVRAFDKAGNESAAVSQNYIYDRSEPSVTPSESSVSKNGKFSITGTAGDGWGLAETDAVSVVQKNNDAEIVIDSSLITIDGNGNWSVNNLPAGSDGKSAQSVESGVYTYTVTVKDKADKTKSANVKALLDMTAPLVSIKSYPVKEQDGSTDFEFRGSADDGSDEFCSGVSEVWIKTGSSAPEEGVFTGAVKADGTSSWSKTLAIAEGSGTLYVCAKDSAGNISNWVSQDYYLDCGAPVITKAEASAEGYINENYTLTVSASDSNLTKVTVSAQKNGNTFTGSGFPYTFTAENGAVTDKAAVLASASGDGTYIITVIAEDGAGKTKTETKTINIDTTGPVINPVNPGSTNGAFTLSASAYDTGKGMNGSGAGLWWSFSEEDDSWQTMNATDAGYSADITAEALGDTEGVRTVYIKGSDGLNSKTEHFTFYYDRNDPVLTVSASTDTAYTNSAYTLTMNASDANLDRVTVSVKKNGSDYTGTALNPYPKTFTASESSFTGLTASISTDFGDGKYIVTVTAYDKAGKSVSDVKTVQMDTQAPGIPSVTKKPSISENNALKFNFEGTAADTGTLPSGLSTVYILVDAETAPAAEDVTGAVEATGTENWNKEITFTSEGSGKIYVCAKDNAGNFSAWKEEEYYLDTAFPSVTETDIGNTKVIRSTEISLSGTITESNALAETDSLVVTVKRGETVLSTKKVAGLDGSSGSGSYDWEIEFTAGNEDSDITSDGDITIEITVKDAAGKETTITRNVTVDTTAPSVSMTKKPLASENAVSPYQFGGSSGDGDDGTGVSEVWVTIGSTVPAKGETAGAVKATGTVTWFASLEVSSEGSGKVYVCAKDNAGNWSDWTEEEYFFDTANPTVASGAAATTVTGTLMSLSGSASDNSGIASVSVTQSLNGGIGLSLGNAAFADGTWTIGNLPRKNSSTGTGAATDGSDDGKYTYTITATDNAGKTSSITRTIVLDNTAPAIEIIAPADGEALESNTKTLKGTASDAGSGVASVSYTLYRGTAEIGSGSTSDGKLTLIGETWQAANVSLGEGQGTLRLVITAADEKGNSAYTERTFYVDNAYPGIDEKSIGTAGKTVKAGFKLAGLVRDTNELDGTAAVTISAEGYAGAVLGLSDLTLITGDNQSTYAVYGADIDKANEGNWYYWEKSFTPGSGTGELADGTYTFTITAKDTAGKQTPIMRNITVDTAAPEFTTDSFSIEETAKTGTDANKWYGSTVLTPSITVSDALSGVQKVSWESGTTNSNGTLGGTKGSGQFIKGDSDVWSGTVNLAEGLNYIKITAVDAAGNASTYGTVEEIRTDVTMPAVSGETTDLLVKKDGSVTISLTVTDAGSGTDSVKVSYGDVTDAEVPYNSETGKYEKTIAAGSGAGELADGTYTFSYTAADKTGNTNNTVSRRVTVDTTAPVISSKAVSDSTAGYTAEGTGVTYYGSAVVAVKVTAEDTNGSGLASVEYAVNKNSSLAPAEESSWAAMSVSGSTATASNAPIGDGSNFIWFRAADRAGNTSTPVNMSVTGDFTAPEVTSEKSGSQMASTSTYSAGFTVTDSGSGVKSVKVRTGTSNFEAAGTVEAVKGSGNIWTASIPSEGLTNAIVYAQATDNVGNSYVLNAFQLTTDTENPEVVITSPQNGSTVNKTITVSGTGYDNLQLDSVKLEYQSAADAWTEITGNEGTVSNWKYTIDTTTAAYTAYDSNAADGKQLKLRITGTDSSGRTGSNIIEVTVDQDSDRPEISFTNLDVRNGIYLLKTSSLNGNIVDDDGAVTKLEYRLASSGDYTEATVSNGSFSIPEITDGNYPLYFKVTDAAGTTFESAASSPEAGSTAELATPKVSYNSNVLSAAGTFLKDTIRPVLAENGSESSSQERFAPYSLSGTYTETNLESIKYKVKAGTGNWSGEADASWSDGTWSITGAEADGTYEYAVTAIDAAGNTAEMTRIIKKDTSVPTVGAPKKDDGTEDGIDLAASEWINTTAFSIKGTVSDPAKDGTADGYASGVDAVQYELYASAAEASANSNGEIPDNIKKSGPLSLSGENYSGNINTDTYKFLVIKATDKAGNAARTTAVQLKTDTDRPEITSKDPNGQKAATGTTAITLTVSGTDKGGSGIASVSVYKIGSTTITGEALTALTDSRETINGPAVENPSDPRTWSATITIPANEENGTQYQQDGNSVWVKVTDNAGNETTEEAFRFVMDVIKPELKISSPVGVNNGESETATVNKTITLSGIASDNKNLAGVTLRYTQDSDGFAASSDKWTNPITFSPENSYNWSTQIDTTAYDASKPLYIKAVTTDEAGNESLGTKLTLTIDQDGDRPEISFANLEERPVDDNKLYILKATSLIGSISDDDGTVAKLEYRLADSGNYTEATVTNGSFSIPVSADNEYSLWFKVTDAAGTTFESTATAPSAGSAEELAAPKVKYGSSTLSAKGSVIRDTVVPKLSENGTDIASQERWVKADYSLSGTIDEANLASITYTVNDGDEHTITPSGSSWTIAGEADDGEYSYEITATDKAGNQVQITRKINKDTAQPSVGIPELADGTSLAGWQKTSAFKIRAHSVSDPAQNSYASGLSSVAYELYDTAANASSHTNPKVSGELSLDNGYYSGTINAADFRYLVIKATDKSGNENWSEGGAVHLQIDGELPVITYKSSTGQKLVRGDSSVELTVSGTDAGGSGIASVSVSKIGDSELTGDALAALSVSGNAVTYNAETGAWSATITIPANGQNGTAPQYQQNGSAVQVKVTDGAGNYITENIFQFKVDTSAPSVVFSSPADVAAGATIGDRDNDKVTVNKTITLKGSASDDNTLSLVTVSYTTAGFNAAPENWTVKNYETVAGYNWSLPVNTEDFDNAEGIGTLYVKAVAVDEAGNTSSETKLKLSIDQDTDRPIISFNDLDLNGMAKGETDDDVSHYVWRKETNIIRGFVTDDDGVTAMSYKKGNSGEWRNILINNGSFEIRNLDDGAQKIYFKVTDKAGTDHVSAASGKSGAKLSYSDGDDTLYHSEDTVLYVKVDTASPEKQNIKYSVYNSTSSEWCEEVSDISELNFGGIYTKLRITLQAKDSNGIESAAIYIEGAGTPSATGTAGNAVTVEGEEWIPYTIELPLNTTHKKLDDLGNETDADEFDYNDIYSTEIRVTDNAGLTSSTSVKLKVDNEDPDLKFTVPETTVKDVVTISGSVENEKPKVSYAVTRGDSEAEPSEWEFITDSSYSWDIRFDGAVKEGEVHTTLLRNYLVTLGYCEEYELDSNDQSIRYDTVTSLYLWVKAEDASGNVTKLHKIITVDPQGGRPDVNVTYPSASQQKLGGTITLMGTATDNNAPNYAWLQIYKKGQSWNKDAMQYVLSKNYTIANMSAPEVNVSAADIENLSDTSEITDNYAIRIPVSGISWNLSINGNKEFESKNSNTKDWVMKFYATDDEFNRSIAITREITIDKDTPIFVQNSLKLVQYDNDENVVSSQDYTPDMSLKGVWYLTGEVTDQSGIKKIICNGVTVVDEVASGTAVSAGSDTADGRFSAYNAGTAEKPVYNYRFNIPMGSNANQQVGTDSVTIEVFENTTQNLSATKVFSVMYDNKAPEVIAAGDKFNISTSVVNTNGFYTFGSVAKEPEVNGVAQTGVSRVAFFFTQNNNFVYDILVQRGENTGNELPLSAVEYDAADGLYWKALSITDEGINGAAVTLTAADKNVHTGSLVKIAGVIYTVKSVNGAVITLDGSPLSTATAAKVAIAGVIDNDKQEGVGSGTPNAAGYYTNGAYDDGDHMPESLIKQGNEWTWEANIKANLLPDGPITLHYVVFDKAGNCSINSVTGCTVQNNGPRIAGVRVGTDEDGNGEVEGDEIKTTGFSGLFDKGYNGNQRITDYIFPVQPESGVKSAFTAKGKIYVKPEIVGGNGTLGYSYKVAERNGSNTGWANPYYAKAYSNDNNLGTGTVDNTVSEGLNAILISVEDMLKKDDRTNENIKDGVNQKFTFTIWDSTPKTTIGDNSQRADISVIMDVAIRDTTPPKARILPFYWKSSSANSLFGQSRTNGHIELSGDLPTGEGAAFNSSNSGEFDLDPKVSGKIKVEGLAWDNKLLSSLSFKLNKNFGDITAGTETTMATYGNGSWSCGTAAPAEIPSAGWAASVQQATYGELKAAGIITDIPSGKTSDTAVPYASQEYGHVVHWILYLDTANISGVASADVKVTVTANDQGSPVLTVTANDQDSPVYKISYTSKPSVLAEGQTGGTDATGALTSEYQMDIVPYIAGIKTGLSSLKKNNSSVYDRTALGHYPVSSVESIWLYGFNLAGGKLYDKTGTESAELEEETPTSTGSTKVWYNSDSFTYEKVYELTYNTSASKAGISEFTSGPVYVKVGTIKSLNNENKNDSYGSAYTFAPSVGVTGDKDTYVNFYNRQPNGDNNNKLTDDVVLDVWGIDSEAVKPKKGAISQPVMAINPVNHDIGFAFVNGSLAFSMPNKGHSYDYSLGGIDYWTSIGLAYDSKGYSYATTAGGDINASVADQFRILTSRWGRGTITRDGYKSGTNHFRLELIGQVDFSGIGNPKTLGYNTFDKERVKSPSIATTNATTTSTTVYLAYYDAINDEIRFKHGKFKDTKDNSWTNLSNEEKVSSLFGDYYGISSENGSQAEGRTLRRDDNFTIYPYSVYHLTHNSLIAGQTSDKVTAKDGSYYTNGAVTATALTKQESLDTVSKVVTDSVYAGKYVCIAAIENGGNTDDAVIAVWWDAVNSKLMYSFNKTPQSITSGSYLQSETGWSLPVPIFDDGIGEYCRVTVDANNHVHIAAYDGLNGDLWYAYVPDFDAPATRGTCIVDSYGIIGSELNIDVAMVKIGEGEDAQPIMTAVPYISYYSGNCARPKIAYWSGNVVLSDTTLEPGVLDDVFTGLWESSTIPTTSRVSLDHVNIGVWKDANGEITWSTKDGKDPNAQTNPGTIGEKSFTAGVDLNKECYGMVYGNGTKNPVLGYAITKGSGGYIETAQMK